MLLQEAAEMPVAQASARWVDLPKVSTTTVGGRIAGATDARAPNTMIRRANADCLKTQMAAERDNHNNKTYGRRYRKYDQHEP